MILQEAESACRASLDNRDAQNNLLTSVDCDCASGDVRDIAIAFYSTHKTPKRPAKCAEIWKTPDWARTIPSGRNERLNTGRGNLLIQPTRCRVASVEGVIGGAGRRSKRGSYWKLSWPKFELNLFFRTTKFPLFEQGSR
jgi:hypothetical protein